MSGKFALIIANTEYTDTGLAQLTAPGKDAKEFGRVLDSSDLCAFTDVIILFNEDTSKVNETIDHFFSNKKPDDLLVLYFSGHGVRDEYGSLYLAVKNTNRARLRSTAIKSEFITEVMDQCRSRRQVLILDCCNSGAFAQGTKAATGVSIGTASAFEGKGYGRVVLTASDSTQFAWEGDKVIGTTENSLFTHYLVKGLEGEADTNGDGRITIDELYDYAYEQIVNITPKQTPGKWSYKQQGEILLRHNIRLEDTKPVPLPADLIAAINSSLPFVREGAVSQLEELLKGKNISLARSARLALEKIIAEDDSRRIAQVATKALGAIRQPEQNDTQKAEGDQAVSFTRTAQLRRENMEQELRFKTEQTKLIQEKAELEKRLNEERTTNEKIEAVRPVPAPKKSRWSPMLIGIVILAVAIGGVGLWRFLPSLGVAPTQEPTTTIKPTVEATASLTEAAVLPALTEETSSPTEVPSATSISTETGIPTPNAPLPEITDDKGAVMVLVPAGDFTMGSNTGDEDERPSHTVHLDAYYIDKFEVTNALYEACVDSGKCDKPIYPYFFPESPNRIYYGDSQYDKFPVVYVDWNMAKAYCEWRGAHLPTEAQWEKAARGDTDARIYPWKGPELASCKKANFQNCVNRTSEVDNYKDGKSPYGAYDMAGNVWEWVADWYSAIYYENLFSDNPLGPNFGQSRVQRGGSWTKYDIRVSNRVNYGPNHTNFDVGFRCASPLP
ncbi:MAG: SUMF1/EgtB/PvdO family nonheme iron enzyme [Anaerolineales bacterium]